MPSPFPGMDPYLEAPFIWPDLHEALAGEIRAWLNRHLPRPYYARLEIREELGIVADGEGTRRIVPDVAVAARRPDSEGPTSGAAVAALPRSQVSPFLEVVLRHEPVSHPFVEIRDPAQGHQLITLIKLVSPSNKRPGPDREAYQAKQSEVLASSASLLELDLHRGGRRLLPFREVEAAILQHEPPADYLVMLSRAWHRQPRRPRYCWLPVMLTEPLPVVPVPLREGEPEPALDLQYVFTEAYDP